MPVDTTYAVSPINRRQGGTVESFGAGTSILVDPSVSSGPEVGLWNGAPSLLNPDPISAIRIFEDFINPASATASDTLAWVDMNDGATGTNAFQDIAGGWFNIVTAAANNDYHGFRSQNKTFLFAAGKKTWFEARFKIAEATTNESAWWFGFNDTTTTGGFQAGTSGPLASFSGVLMYKNSASMALNMMTSNAAAQATTAAMATVVTNTITRVGFYFDGTATTSVVTPWYEVTGVAGASMIAGAPQNITLAALNPMYLMWGVKAGASGAAETLQTDYIAAVQIR